jgi:hypothetical protein
MLRAPFPRKVALLLLVAVLAAPWASAAAPRQSEARPAQAAASPQELLNRLWTFLKIAWSETGCMIDPSGRCVPEPRPQAETDTGCRIDPSGGCSS